MSPHTLAFIQARMSSSRLPGKVLAPIGGLPSIVGMVRRVERARRIDAVVVVTSDQASDDPLAATLAAHGIACFRGPLDDVLGRFAQAARAWPARTYARLTGDCPLIDPSVIDAVLRLHEEAGADYASNVDPPSFPDGLDVECFSADALARADREARQPMEREHVTPWMRSAASGLRRANHRAIADLSALRLTVDHPDDLEMVRRLVDLLPDGDWDLFDILRAMSAHPELAAMNPHARNEGLEASRHAAS